jgi:hypothetical protein
VVAVCNRLGIIVDVSHISDKSFYDALKVTRAPIIASYLGCCVLQFIQTMKFLRGVDRFKKILDKN